MGAPLPGAPPCILQRRFPRTARDRHGFPLRVRAPHRGAWFVCNSSHCIKFSLCVFDASTPWRDGADNRLSTRMDVHVLHCDLLLALAAVAVERVEQGRIGARKLVRLAQVLAARLECLLSEHRSPVALHGGIVCGQQLSRDHAFKLVSRPDTDQREKSSIVLWEHRFRAPLHAFYSAVFLAPPAIGTGSRSGSGLRIGVLGSYAIPRVASS